MVIELAKNYPDRKRFEAWLLKQGHEIDHGKTDITYVDLEDVSLNMTARKIFRELKRQFNENGNF